MIYLSIVFFFFPIIFGMLSRCDLRTWLMKNAYVDSVYPYSGHSRRLTGARGMVIIFPANGFPPTLFLGHSSSCSPAIFVPRDFLINISFNSCNCGKKTQKKNQRKLSLCNVEYTRQQRRWLLKVRWTMVLASFSAAALCFVHFCLSIPHPFLSTLDFSCIVVFVGLFCFVVPGSF